IPKRLERSGRKGAGRSSRTTTGVANTRRGIACTDEDPVHRALRAEPHPRAALPLRARAGGARASPGGGGALGDEGRPGGARELARVRMRPVDGAAAEVAVFAELRSRAGGARAVAKRVLLAAGAVAEDRGGA